MPRAAATIYVFGRFRLDLARRELTAEGAIVALSSRAFDVLALLIEHRDRVVTKDEIMAAVWRGLIVEDNNLAVQISALRRALEQRPGQPAMIVTVPGRGYRFVADVDTQEAARPAIVAEGAADLVLVPAAMSALPARRTVPWRAAGLAGLLVLACMLLYAPIENRFRPKEPPRLSIVVMPFRNLTGDAKQDYLADAVSDDLTTDLSHIPGSLVIARETADAYKGRAVPVNVIGRTLNVRYLMEGSLSQGASGVHINAQLIDTATSGHLWADRFDVARDKVGDAQFDIVRHIASAMNYTLVDVESARSLRERPDNPDAVDLHLQARSVLDRDASATGLQSARQLLQKAVALDGNYGEALAELGRTLLRIITIDDPDEVADHARAKELIARAMKLAPRSERVILARGALFSSEENCVSALPSFTLAIALEPNDVDARASLGECAFRLGQPSAMLEQLLLIKRIDPQGASYGKRLEKEGMCYLFLDEPRKASSLLRQALEQMTNVTGRHLPSLGWEEYASLFEIAADAENGDLETARTRYRDYNDRWPDRTVWHLGIYFSKASSRLATYARFKAALTSAGMPEFAPENTEIAGEGATGDFAPAPQSVDGAVTIDTATVSMMLGHDAATTVFDVGSGAVTIPSAIWIGDDNFWQDPHSMIIQRRTRNQVLDVDSPIVVMSDGAYGTASDDEARQLISMGFRKVLWYRAGEESWAQAHLPYRDRRLQ